MVDGSYGHRHCGTSETEETNNPVAVIALADKYWRPAGGHWASTR
jgi:hypothetical protein